MVEVIGVRFRTAGKIYFFNPKEFQVKSGDHVIVETARGIEFGSVVSERRQVKEKCIGDELKPVLRIATKEDEERAAKNREKEKEAFENLDNFINKFKEKYPDVTERMTHHVNRVNNYLEQILYYVRSENAEKDYIINDARLSKIISNVALKNKDDLLENDITFEVSNADRIVLTDAKWMEFMLNQIVNNSIKYKDKTKAESYIKISAAEDKKCIVLEILDNGIGINASDLPRVPAT